MAITRLNNNSITSITALPSAVAVENQPAFLAYLNANQEISSGVDTKVQFDTEVYDTDGCYDNSTNYRFTPTTAGKYFVFTEVLCNANSNSNLAQARAFIFKNGSKYDWSVTNFSSNNAKYSTITLDSIIDFNGSTDYVEVYSLITDTSGTPNILGTTAPIHCRFGAYKLI